MKEKIEEVPEEVEEFKEEKKEKKPKSKKKSKKIKEELPESPELPKPSEEPKKSFFTKLKEKISTTQISQSKFEEIFWDLEIALLESNVAVEVIEKIKKDLSEKITSENINRGEVEKNIKEGLKESIESLFNQEKIDLIGKINKKKPYVISFFGINGSGKTTTIAKLAYLLQKNNFSIVLAASDTFRAAAIDQLQKHADNLKIKLIKHSYGSDPAAVAFDAIKYAESHNIDVVLIDTAGRMHSNKDLIREMEKIVRVSKPDLNLFIGEAITGNDCIEQAKTFNESIKIDGIILSKADIDEKGGASISVSYVTKKPILYLGTGQNYKDLEEFNSEILIKKLGL